MTTNKPTSGYLSSEKFKPKVYKTGGWWYCEVPGYTGVGITPQAAFEAMRDEWRWESVLSELTARQNFFIINLRNRAYSQLCKGLIK